MNRRAFLAAILTLFGLRRIPKPIPAPVFPGLNAKYLEWYISESPRFEFGFTGFKEVNSEVNSGYLLGSNVVAPPLSPFMTIKADSPE